MNIIVPTTLIAAALAGLFLYVSPQYNVLTDDIDKRAEFISSIEKIDTISEKYEAAKTWRDRIRQSDKMRIEEILPNTFDNVQFHLDIDRLAVKNGIALGTVDITPQVDTKKLGYATYAISFGFTAPYAQNAKQFMADLEKSLTLFDVVDMGVSVIDNNNLQYSFVLNTYSMK